MTVETTIDHVEEIKALLERNDLEGVKALVKPLHGADMARILEGLEPDDAVRVFRLLDPEEASSVLLETNEHTRKTLTSAISSDELVAVVEEMETDDATDVISELPLEEAKQVLEGIKKEEAREVQKLLKYPEDTAGGKMQTELLAAREDMTVEDTIEELRKKSDEIERISSVFVVDADGRLVGDVPLEKLILARPETLIKDIANKDVKRVTTDVDQEEVARMFEKYDLLSLPVVDHEGRLVGRITIDDMVDVIEEEIFEDFYRMASLNLGERVLDPPLRSFRMRAPWLLLNLATAFLAASVVKLFESTIESIVVLAVFMPIVAGMGGNAATQAITVVVRGLALGDLEMKHAKKVLTKEVLVGLANGLLTGALAAAVAYLLGANIMIGVLLFLAMTANLIIAGLSGSLIPLVLKWLNADPAIASSIFVTTCTDVGGFFTFLGLAALFMKLGLL